MLRDHQAWLTRLDRLHPWYVMKAASDTATKVRHRLAIAIPSPSFLYSIPVQRFYMLFLYVVRVHSVDCTVYSFK